jgi:hypothetical protein
MATNTAETVDLAIKDLSGFAGGLDLILKVPENEKLRPAAENALSAECVQCGLRLTGPDLLRFGAGDESGDARLERLRNGYCGRNGCECLFYRVTCGADPQIDWPKLIHPAHTISDDEKASVQRRAARDASKTRWKKRALRTALALAALAFVFILRQLWVGGTIPFIREPENFQVDRTIDAR